MTLLRNTQSIAWQAALARHTARIARNRTRFEADVAAKVAIWTQAAEEKANRAQANLLKQRGFERWCADYLTSPAYRLLPPGPKVEAQPEPAAETVTIDAAARFLVQHPVSLEGELAAALDGFPGGPQRQPGEAGASHQPPLPDPLVSLPPARRVTPPQAIGDVVRRMLDKGEVTPSERVLAAQAAAQEVPPVAVDDLHESIEYGLAHPGNRDAQRLPSPHFFQRGPHDQIFVAAAGLEHQVGGKLLVAYALNRGEAPKCITTRREVRDYLARVQKMSQREEQAAA